MVTAKDIAAAAGVSQSAVSAVLSGRAEERRISRSTAEKVLATARKLNYRINLDARNLRSGKSRAIGILLPIWSNNVYGELIGALEARLAEAGYYCSFAFWQDKAGQKRAAESILCRRPAGIITVEPGALESSEGLPPVVSLLNYDPRFDCVEFDRNDIFTQAIEFFYRMGHRKIAHPDSRHAGEFSSVTGHFAAELQRYGLSTEWMAPIVRPRTSDEENAVRIADWYLAQKERPTAMMITSDTLAIWLIRELTRRNVKLPQDLSLIGCDDILMARAALPSLSTFGDSADKPLVGQLLECLFARLEHPEQPCRRIAVKRRLIVRESVVAWDMNEK